MELDIYNITHPSNYLTSIVTGTISAAGVIGNLALIILILSDYSKRKAYEWLLFALAVNDFLLSLNNVALESPFIIHHDRIECKVAGGLEYLFGSLSFHILPFVAYHRYLSLHNQQKCAMIFTHRNILIGWLSLALMAFCCWICPFIAMDSLGQDELGYCGLQIRNTFLAVVIFACGTCLLIGYIFLVYCSYKVIIKIGSHRKEANARSQIQSRLIAESRQLITVITIIATIPLFTQVPPVTLKVLEIFTPYFGPWLNRIFVSLYPTTATANAFVTLYVIQDYRKVVIKMFKKVKSQLTGTSNAVVPISNGRRLNL